MFLRVNSPPVSWENILGSLDDGVIILNREGRVMFFNQAAEVLTDLSHRQVFEQSYRDLFRYNPWLVEIIKKSQPPQHSTVRGEAEFVTYRDRRVPVSIMVSPLDDRNGEVWGSILLARDLTHRKELEEDLRRSDRLAMLGTLAAGLAHEIKNPLGGIKGAAQLLKREAGAGSSVRQYTDIIVREVDRVDHLIEQLLDLSRPVEFHMASLNIHELLDEVLLLERHSVEAGRVLVRKQFDPSLPLIRGDRAQLNQVFLNVVKNALQAIDGDGSLTITTRMETDFHIREEGKGRGKFIRVEVQDDGPGIPEEDLPYIFSPFFTTKERGTGLGLAICHRIITEHGGLIRVESREGEGAVFKISLLVAE
jgi:two-component system nitrogen regulation sensor histidine kinase GlnL